ncbi:hypothetical protein HDU82_007750 [Entophlyctis luteolus]|nr:hypothetical protein HDU82_007750 [Entophlyctis luteolus]
MSSIYAHNFKRRTSSSSFPAYGAPRRQSAFGSRGGARFLGIIGTVRGLTFRQGSSAFFKLSLVLAIILLSLRFTRFFAAANDRGSASVYTDSTDRTNHTEVLVDMFLSVNQPFNERSVRIMSPLSDPTGKLEPGVKNTRRFSHFRCLGDDNNIDGRAERACVFENVCYDVEGKEWLYYSRPDTKLKPILFDSVRGERFGFWEEGLGFIGLSGFTQGATDWGPTVRQSASPASTSPSTTAILKTAHALFHLAVHDDNLGHLLWEEMGALWYSMVRLNVFSSELVAMHTVGPLPDRALNRKFRDAFFAALTPRAPVSFDEYVAETARAHGGGAGASHVCFDQLMVGGNMLRFFQNRDWHNMGHEPLFYSLRNRVLGVHGIDPRQVPQRHKIVFTNKTETLKKAIDGGLTKNRGISNLAELVNFVRAKYAGLGVDVEVVEWQKLPMKAQLELMHSTTIFISPSGGVSTLLPFLPEGAHAILIDYYERNGVVYYGTAAGHSISMEAPLWNHVPHVKKQYYQVWEAKDLVSDVPGKTVEECDWRYEVSTVVDLRRMDTLIEAAFEDMEA